MIHAVFPTLIHEFKVDDFESIKDEIVYFAYKEREKDPTGNKLTNRGGWQSHSYYCYDNILFNTIQLSIVNYLRTNKIFQETIALEIDALWMNINNKGDYNVVHNHPCCDWVGCFYINTFEDCGGINFESPNAFIQGKELVACNNYIAKKLNFYSTYSWDQPEEGTIFLFPSHVYHSVIENKVGNDRISASFNITLDWIRE